MLLRYAWLCVLARPTIFATFFILLLLKKITRRSHLAAAGIAIV
jgi:hypothetical protein